MQRTAKILVVEDNLDMLEGIVDYLEVSRDLEFDVDIYTAMNGRRALEVMQTVTPDLIISDIMMPQMDGMTFYRQVRSNMQWIRIPFIFLTARGDESDIRLGREMGADLYITKPFEVEQLVDLINTQIKRYFRRLEAAKLEISGAKAHMLQVINHELRTPLTYVTAYTEILQASLKQSDSPGSQFEYLTGIQSGCVRLGNIIDDLLTVIEIRSGRFGKKIQEATTYIDNPTILLRQAAKNFQTNAANPNIRLHLPPPTELPAILGDAEAIEDALTRLIDNAIKFTEVAILLRVAPEGEQRVELNVEQRDDAIVFSIVDYGIGFPEHMQSDIFRFFVQHDRDYLEQQGCGAGLSTAFAIVEQHDGFITAKSEKGGETRFEVWLPTAEARNEGRSPKPGKRKATVLLVEDDYNLLSGLRDILEIHDGDYEYQVLAAEDGLEALELLEHAKPDIIVSDIMMPRMNGYELLESIRQKSEWTQIPVIFLTAMGEKIDIHKGRVMGVEEYVTKPYNTDHLLALIDTRLNRYFTIQNALHEDIEVLRDIFLKLLQQDLRPSLSAVNANSQTMVDLLNETMPSESDEVSLATSLRNIQSHSGRLHRNIEDLIKLTEMRANRAVAEQDYVSEAIGNLGGYIQGEVDHYNLNESKLGKKILVNFGNNLPVVQGDILILNDVFKRLLEITIGLIIDREGSGIRLEATKRDTFLDVSVIFDGEGLMQVENEAFATMTSGVDESILKKAPFGPSLIIVNENMQHRRGRLRYESDGFEHRFVVSIPLALAAESV